ncbi:MAG: radical SAM protein [Oscillospiraceae bacterium]|nr:radical SAM protein [Oscillospiraceae bacterium]
MSKEFEIGPIRPPSEAGSLLLRATRNCPWNKCKFCRLYKQHEFSARTVEEIKADIDQAALYRNNIRNGQMESIYALPEETRERYRYIMQWIASGEDSVFLQDANTMVLSFDKLRSILEYLRETHPWVKRVTTYGRVDSLDKFTVEQLAELKVAGLDRIHSGFESGSDSVLRMINKGHTKAQEIEAGLKVKASGIELSVYFMPGVGGRGLSDGNASETADVINRINPDFVRIRTFVAQKGTQWYDEAQSGEIKECTDIEKMLELKKMIGLINKAEGYLFSDHIINLFEDVNGNMAQDKERMLSVFSAYEKLDDRTRRRYQVARRMGMVGRLADLDELNIEQSEQVDNYLADIGEGEAYEEFLSTLLRRYI